MTGAALGLNLACGCAAGADAGEVTILGGGTRTATGRVATDGTKCAEGGDALVGGAVQLGFSRGDVRTGTAGGEGTGRGGAEATISGTTIGALNDGGMSAVDWGICTAVDGTTCAGATDTGGLLEGRALG